MELSRERPPLEGRGLLYPMMVIAAIAVIVFSVLGIASITGWMPSGLISRAAAATAVPVAPEIDAARSGIMFECAECGVIKTLREIERSNPQGTTRSDSVAAL